MKHVSFKSAVMLALVSTMALAFSSCGSSKQTIAQTNDEVELKASEAQKLAEEKPTTRGWGEATNFSLSQAKNLAENQAKYQLASSISPKIIAAVKENGIGWDSFHSDGENSSRGTDEGSKSQQTVRTVTEQVLQNVVNIKTNTFKTKDNRYHVFVCVEYQGGESALAKGITKTMKQQVPDEERIKMEYEFQKFEKQLEEDLKNTK